MKKIVTDYYGDSILVLTGESILSNIIDSEGFIYSPSIGGKDHRHIFEIEFGNIRVYYQSVRNEKGMPMRTKGFSQGIFTLSETTEEYISRYYHMIGEKVSFNI